MKKIININLSSRLIPIEDSAYELLRLYLDSLKRYFSKEEGAEEIVGDIESRIAEIFQDLIKKGAHCITDQDVENIKASMGTPEQLGEDDEEQRSQQQQHQHKQAESSFAHYVRPRKRYYRDPENKVLGGVCSGLGAYFNTDPLVFRILFAFAAILWGGGIVLYFILWFATPEAFTSSEKLEMRGERVDLNNIKATVQEEMNAFRHRFEGMSNDVRNFSEGRGKQFGRDAGSAIENMFRGLARGIGYIAKGFFLFLAVVMLFLLVVGLFMSTIFSAVFMPVKDLILDGGAQTLLFWPALVLVIGIPILSLTMFLVRKMAGYRNQNKFIGYSLGFFWLLGVAISIWLGVSIGKNFSGGMTADIQHFELKQPARGKLYVKPAPSTLEIEDVDFFDWDLRILDDTLVIDNVEVFMQPSESDSFHVEIERYSRGRTTAQAKAYASEVVMTLTQEDSTLFIPTGFSIPRNSKFRGQQVTVFIKVPEGKDVQIDRRLWNDNSHHHRRRNWDEEPVNVRMGRNGQQRLDERKEEQNREVPETDTAESSSDKEYRYKGNRQQQNSRPAQDTARSSDTSKSR